MIWAHVDEERGMVTIPGDKTESAPRNNPMTPAFLDLLARMKQRGERRPVDPIFEVQSVLGSLRIGCEKLGIPKIDHHDLLHLFATTCIESGVDVLVLSKWLGHSDGGALVLTDLRSPAARTQHPRRQVGGLSRPRKNEMVKAFAVGLPLGAKLTVSTRTSARKLLMRGFR
ncbi:MAG: hypothetical protein J6386_06515 [Candidatus Synoicihabitans palmerolidicus]|nr:hypothetical protein [Candidatus Synoicihabitans palmerolidicus]